MIPVADSSREEARGGYVRGQAPKTLFLEHDLGLHIHRHENQRRNEQSQECSHAYSSAPCPRRGPEA